MNAKLSVVFLIVAFVIVASAAIQFGPRLASVYLQIQAGSLINEAMRAEGWDSFSDCKQVQGNGGKFNKQINKALPLLEKSIFLSASSSHHYLLLGRGLCLLGESGKAIESYQAYTQLRPRNPLGHLELAMAYQTECEKTPYTGSSYSLSTDYRPCKDETLIDKINGEWTSAGINPDDFYSQAQQAYTKNDFRTADLLYRFSYLMNYELTPIDITKWGISSIISSHTLPSQPYNRILRIWLLKDKLKIEGEDLQWLRDDPGQSVTFGDRLIDHPSTDRSVGVMWWYGKAISTVHVESEGRYDLFIRAKGEGKEPLSFEVETDFKSIGKFKLDPNNESWQIYNVQVDLTPGTHLISINFIKDNGDLILDWIDIQKQN